jgi:hypothetical protein
MGTLIYRSSMYYVTLALSFNNKQMFKKNGFVRLILTNPPEGGLPKKYSRKKSMFLL